MKKIIPILSLLVMLAYSGHAQKGTNQLSIGAEADFPMGSFGDAYKTGFGATIKGLYGVGKAGQLTLTTGYSSFKGKSGTTNGYSYAGQTFSMIPIMVGYRHHFSAFYLEPQAGITKNTTKVTGYNYSETKFAFALNAGYLINALDLSVRYHSEGDVLSMFAARFAYNIPIGNKK